MKVARLVALEPEIQNESTTHQIPVQLEFNKLISRRTFSFLPDDNSVLQTSNTSPIMPGSSPLSTPLTRSQVSSSTHLLSSKDHDSQNSNMLDPLQILEPRDTQDPDTASIQERLRQMVG